MEILRQLSLFLHFVGLASLLGHFLVQVRNSDRSVNVYMLYASGVMLVSGILLVFSRRQQDPPLEVNDAKIGTKLVILLVITALCYFGWKRKDGGRIFMSIGLLTLINVGIAVFWT